MAEAKTVRLRHVNGATVEVPEEKVDGLLTRGFTAEETKKSTARKSSSSSK